MMKIAIDLDNTLVNLDVFQAAPTGLRGTYPRPSNWFMTDIPSDIRQACFFMFKDERYMGSLQPLPGAISKMHVWCKLYDVTVVTCRQECVALCTAELVKELFPNATLEICSGKKPFLEEGKPVYDVVIDDAPHHIVHAISCGIPRVVMVSNDETPYNHRFRGIEGLEVVSNIKEIEL